MKITVKTVGGESFSLNDVLDSISVGDLKARVSDERGLALPTLKLVYKGKVLADDSASLAVCGVTELGFIVLFVQAPPKLAAAPAVASETSAPASGSTAVASTTVPAAAPTVAPAAAPAAVEGPAASGASSLLSGSALETAIAGICEMGFDRIEVTRAMRAAFNNPERAVEYLATGTIPGEPAAAAAAAAAPAPAVAAPPAPVGQQPAPQALPFNMFDPAAPAEAGGQQEAAGGGALGLLASHPQFQMLRRAVQSNPQVLMPMLQELGRSNPQLLQLINSHQPEFLAMLAGGEGEGEDQYEEMPQHVIELSEQDAAAIERLQALGFDRDASVEAYLACDKNEELAANFLAEQMFD
eukprot:CAMPEP_0119109034 /NCGR_PEP_ID=MMETSP1180-20130426/16885_1 /TAXON_ID=3052 ORGANISM="Chlamydomonas cf sp, Strain CCMP681" /NCGR_SAMPLE_ID=MMETSP1180 /ASSEMBLY_ACC=CAM_ASM_000741 /LENGTH=354 /DNA_ID=CAMNT_0007094729 /DNA_START=12 /DNA_END=1076 /DNA_ORIENTATION=-